MTTGIDLPGDLLAPSYGTRSLAAVLPAVAGALGVDVRTSTGLSGKACAGTFGLPRVQRAVVVLVDGLGMQNLTERGGHAPFLRSLRADGRALVSSFPSTTAAALATLGTGTSPGRTGLVGYTQRNPATGGLVTTISWSEQSDPYRPGPKLSAPVTTAPTDLQREPTVLETLAAAGTTVVAPGPAKFDRSGMTRAALRGPTYVAAETLSEQVDATVRALRAPGLVYLYHGTVDKVGHRDGPDSWQWGDALEATDAELRRLVRAVPRGTLVLITADHGQVAPDPARQHDVAATPELAAGVALLGGEPRASHVYVEPGTDPRDVAVRWRQVLGGDALVVLRDDAVAAGWLGPVADHVLPVLGDVIVVARGRATVVDSRLHPSSARSMPGVHGSLTPAEMKVPLLVAQA